MDSDHPITPELLAGAFAAAPAGIVVTAADGPGNPVVYANEAFTAITGYSTEEVMGRSLRMLQGAETDRRSVETLRAALAERRPISIELLNYRKNGQAFWMGVRIRPVFEPSGRLCCFVGVLSDLTERHLADDVVRESEERLRAVTEAMPLPMLRIRLDGHILEANQIAHHTFGVPQGQLVGRQIEEFGEPGDTGAHQLCQTMQARGTADRIEVHARQADGSPIILMASAQLYTVRGDSRYLLIFYDITELKRRELVLIKSNERAERTSRARMRFLAAASHDLRQPLQALAMFSSALDHHVATPQGRTIVRSMKTSLHGMEEMLDSLLDMSRLDAGAMRPEPQVFLINDILERLEAECRQQATAAGLHLIFVPSSAVVRSDPKLLSRIIGNLLSNAVRYTRQGRILVGCRHRRNSVRVMVCDTGPGIPESQRLAIFGEFHQGDVSGRGAGMGLGLSIVQRFARLLGHRIEVRSVEGRGSTFSVEVPLAEEWQAPAAREAVEEDVREIAGAVVLVVDDNTDIRSALQIMLAAWGCDAVAVSTADEAFAALDGKRPDIILADLHLANSENGGVTAIAAIRHHVGADIPAFLLTADTEAQPGRGGGGVAVLHKPLDPLDLRTALADALQGP
jgi:PAS domain S-box-containing protein